MQIIHIRELSFIFWILKLGFGPSLWFKVALLLPQISSLPPSVDHSSTFSGPILCPLAPLYLPLALLDPYRGQASPSLSLTSPP